MLLIFLILSSVPCQADETNLSFAGLKSIFPYAFIKDGVYQGIDIDIVDDAMRRLGKKATFQPLPLKRMLSYLEEGKIDGTIHLFHHKSRERFLIYSTVPVHNSTYRIFIKKGSQFLFNSLNDLYGKRIGKVRGIQFSREFEQAAGLNKFTIAETRSTQSNLKKLITARIDGFAANSEITHYYIKKLNLSAEVDELPTPLIEDRPVYFALSKNAKKIKNMEVFIQNLNRVMNQMKNDGTFYRVNRKYYY